MSDDPWFSKAFGSFYTEVYAHRNEKEAQNHLPSILNLARLSDHSCDILDLGCGQGRYTQLLKQLGHRVIGLDYSLELLKLAKTNASHLSLCRGDMLHLPFSHQFDRILSLFTSFGYFELDRENVQVLQQMSKTLKKGGLLYLDFLNANLVQASNWQEKKLGNFIQKSKKEILAESNIVKKTIELYRESERQYQYHEMVKLYDINWFKKHALQLELDLQQIYGDYQANPFDPETSPRLIMVFEKNS